MIVATTQLDQYFRALQDEVGYGGRVARLTVGRLESEDVGKEDLCIFPCFEREEPYRAREVKKEIFLYDGMNELMDLFRIAFDF